MSPEHPASGLSHEDLYAEASGALATLTAARHTLAVAESLTGGLLAATLTDVPGASAAFRGGVCAYATDVKTSLLDVPAALVASVGAVSGDVAAAMALGARTRLGATYGLGTTGVAGPEPQEGRQVGTVFVAVAGPGGAETLPLRLPGDRAAIRRATCREALALLRRTLDAAGTSADG
ncbi:MAG TPA: nicotinamide-nucleotide amidohydrolase family protein [Nocardioidaceae bacterium]|nr:nicotinamide-nucleotide amidohydrolase family protein [Nocardioidaceae bacterium]